MPARHCSSVWLLLLLLAGPVLLLGCKSAPQPPGPSEVGVVTLREQATVLTRELPGRTAAYGIAEIRPQVNGIVQKRLFEEGSDVRAGAVLYQLDPAPYRAAFDQAKAAFEVAESNLPATRARFERMKGLVAIHAVGQQDFDDASAALQAAEANAAAAKAAMENAKINLDYTPIKSPISGRTGRSTVTVGALVSAYQPVPLAVVQQMDPIYVDVTQSSAELLRLRRALGTGQITGGGQVAGKVRLLLEDGTIYPLEGTLEFRDVTVEPSTGSVTLRMVFPNPDHILLPGMFVRAIVEEGVAEKALLVPQQGVSRDSKGMPTAMVVNSAGQAEFRNLEVDRAIGDKWFVTKGLAPGEQLIVEGLQRVRPGAAVKAVPFVATSGDRQAAPAGK